MRKGTKCKRHLNKILEATGGKARDRTQVSFFPLCHTHLEKEMATHPSTCAWTISWTEEPGKLESMETQSHIRLNTSTSHPLDRRGTKAHFSKLCWLQACTDEGRNWPWLTARQGFNKPLQTKSCNWFTSLSSVPTTSYFMNSKHTHST